MGVSSRTLDRHRGSPHGNRRPCDARRLIIRSVRVIPTQEVSHFSKQDRQVRPSRAPIKKGEQGSPFLIVL